MKQFIVAGVIAVCATNVCLAETQNAVQRTLGDSSNAEMTDLIRRSSTTLNQLEKDIPSEMLSVAKCIAVFPKITEAALVVGGKHGDGIASCRTSDGSWSRVGFVNLSGASLGAQIGVKESDLVLIFTNDKARQSLANGKLTFGADLTATAGSTDKSVGVRTASSDVVAYCRSGGAFIGALLDGTSVNADNDQLHAFYSKQTTLADALSTKSSSSDPTVVSDFRNALPARG